MNPSIEPLKNFFIFLFMFFFLFSLLWYLFRLSWRLYLLDGFLFIANVRWFARKNWIICSFSIRPFDLLVSDYAALLTSTFYSMHQNGNVSITNSLGQSATGRFTLLKRNLYFSFYTSPYPLSTKPKTVQFLDPSGNILEELQVSYEIRYHFCGECWTQGRYVSRKLVSQSAWERLVTLFCVPKSFEISTPWMEHDVRGLTSIFSHLGPAPYSV